MRLALHITVARQILRLRRNLAYSEDALLILTCARVLFGTGSAPPDRVHARMDQSAGQKGLGTANGELALPDADRCLGIYRVVLDWCHIARRFEAIVKGLVPSSYRGFRTPAVESLASLDSREGEGSAYALDPTRRADVAPRAQCANQRRTGQIYPVVTLRITAGAGGDGMNPQVLSGPR
jgi:hypothetical protein